VNSRNEEPLTYAGAGVDVGAAAEAKRRIARAAAGASGPGVIAGVGPFGGVYRLSDDRYVVASVDGVGTKLKVACLAGRHDTVGRDIVNHCVNDILCQGARPVFFMDYIGCGALEPEVIEQVVSGIVGACRDVGCALLGGETAEMPGFYAPGEYDLVGFVVGEVGDAELLDGSAVQPGDAVLGLASSGLHTNGYSLARLALLERAGLQLGERVPALGRPLVDELLEPHRCYLRAVDAARAAGPIHALAHVTGGGMAGNLERVLPSGCDARLERGTWPVPAIFSLVQESGAVSTPEMYRTFNMGIGLLIVVPAGAGDAVRSACAASGHHAYSVGEITEGSGIVKWSEQ
jgi:phosphoribosylformylglycinamidine cyclo-ligase